MTFATTALVALLFVAPAVADIRSQAKQLYDSADYEAVVTLITGLEAGGDVVDSELREYKALSLLALNRPADAERETTAIFEANPLYDVASTAAPRWKALVEKVRTRVWPDLIRRRYDAAKQSFDSRAFAKAVPELEQLNILLAAAQKLGLPGLDDFVTLADGFLKLSRAGLPSTPSPTPVVVAQPLPAPTAAAIVKPAVAIRRDLPAWDPPVGVPRWQVLEGRIAVMVGADGSVKSARIVDSVHPAYNSLLLSAARKWRFEPATRNGTPIESGVEFDVVLDSQNEKR